MYPMNQNSNVSELSDVGDNLKIGHKIFTVTPILLTNIGDEKS